MKIIMEIIMLLIFGIIVSSRNDCHKLIYLQHNDRNLFTASVRKMMQLMKRQLSLFFSTFPVILLLL